MVGILNLANLDLSSLPSTPTGRNLQATDYQQALKDSLDDWRASLSAPKATPDNTTGTPWVSGVAITLFGLVYLATFL